ncbi:pseudouridine synthase [Enterococcus sp. LJL98]
MRLDKLIEQEFQTSRKEMKRLFLRGKVRVDGEVTHQENKNVDSQLHQIEVVGQQLKTQEVYYLLNKPKGVVTANRDAKQATVFDLLDEKKRQRDLFAVGRLDRDTEGLLLLTSNGQLGYDLLHPTKKVFKVYEAWINDEVTESDVKAFKQGIVFLDGTVCQSAELVRLGYDAKQRISHIRLRILEGKFHQVKKMFLACGKKVVQLKRTTMGPLTLGELPLGAYRRLTQEELQQLKPYFR